ncbi:hypothetical protein [Acidianus brierleyi]|uniref:Uncharacterized protein n=1 Tax=Acidianus brierleyi TaxID=41673 RepID=A0A2U9IDQ9_9CREN|nr:hypothetical protein [Acidianus brierleyi]AWR94130.1 hypothetical protein DFR85_05515 [Acidianus brierleyi]
MTSQLTPLEQLQLLVPGYRGYKVKDLIRQDDFLIRKAVADKLEFTISKINELESNIASTSPFSPVLKSLEFTLSKIRTMISELIGMQGGGSDIYARYKINSEELDSIVNHDLQMISIADQIYSLASNGNVEQINPLLDKLNSIIKERTTLFYPMEMR